MEKTKQEKVLSDKHDQLDRKKIILSRVKRKILKHIWLVRITILVTFISIIVFAGISAFRYVSQTQLGYFFRLATTFVIAPIDEVRSVNGRINILVLGKGGSGHEAPDLTDTIIFISLDTRNNQVTMISLPRDIWIQALRAKLNSVYYWGNQKEKSGGMPLAKSVVEELIGQPVLYAAVFDFATFKDVVDYLGGVNVNVEHAFTDTRFPIPGRENDLCDGDKEYKCRYETISFDKGIAFMDGSTALKYVRSRNAQGDEGTDFARAARQQEVIEAIIKKVTTKEVLTSPKLLIGLKELLEAQVETDISEDEAVIIARYFYKSRKSVSRHVLPEDLLELAPKSAQYDNLYSFIPKGGSWEEVRGWVSCTLNSSCMN